MKSGADPTRDEMFAFLNKEFPDSDIWDIEEAIWWFACAYHSGQHSNLYAALSQSPYVPGLAAKQHSDEADEQYCALVVEFSINFKRRK